MQLIRTVAAGVAVLMCGALPAHAQTKRAIVLDDQAKERFVRDPELSPDGKWVAYVVTTTNVEKDKRNSDLWMVSWDGTQQVQLTSSPENESSPKWSPDGRYLAFLTSRGDDDKKDEDKKDGAQIWLLNRAGGEALKLTSVKGGVSDFAWSPDGKRLALAVDDPDPNDEPEKKEGWKRKTEPPIVISRYHFKEDAGGYLGPQHTHLALFDVDQKSLVALTSGTFDEEQPSWSPDGTQVAFVSNRNADPDRTTDTNIYVIEAKAGAAPRQLTTWSGSDGGHPAWSPDGKSIAYLQGDEPRFYAYNQEKLAIVPSAGGDARVLTSALDRSVRAPEWTADGKSILLIVEDDRIDYVGKVPAAGGAVVPLTTGRRVIAGYTQSGSSLAVTSTTSKEPDEVFALEQGNLRRLTHQNDAWMKDVQVAGADDVTFTAKDGTVVNGLIAKPVGAPNGQKLPLILYIHGGPDGQDEHSFEFAREFFAANGYAVLQVNYRGSSGRGSAFQKAIYADWGNKEVVDLLAGVDYALTSGIADPDRLGIGGWSYGGILTNYTIATDGRFKAAVSGASSSLQTTMYGIDQYIVQYDTEMGQPWKNPEVWMKVSYPFFKADRIKTPTLFLCGDKDFNVPIAGVEQMYQALQSLKIDSQLVIYPGQHHGIAVPSYQRDRMERFVAWWDKYLKPDAKSTTSTSNSQLPISKKP